MSAIEELRKTLADLDAALEKIRRTAAEPGADVDVAVDDLNRGETRRRLLAERLAGLEASARRKAADRAAQEAETARQQNEADLIARQAALTERWRKWGQMMTEIDATLPGLWAEYRAMAIEALELGRAARAAGLQLAPDTSAASDVLAAIVSGASGVKDRRK